MLQRNNSEFNRTSNFNGSITMARLNQNQNNLTFYQGWYGICAEDESDCADFNLINGTGSSASKNTHKFMQYTKHDLIHLDKYPTTEILQMGCY